MFKRDRISSLPSPGEESLGQTCCGVLPSHKENLLLHTAKATESEKHTELCALKSGGSLSQERRKGRLDYLIGRKRDQQCTRDDT